MIRFILDLYIFILVFDALTSYIPALREYTWVRTLSRAASYTTRPVRALLPQGLPIDLSPVIVIILIQLIKALW